MKVGSLIYGTLAVEIRTGYMPNERGVPPAANLLDEVAAY